MVITANQVQLFFTENDQMAIPQATVIQIANEGIVTIEDLSEFTDSEFKRIADNLKSPPAIPDPNNAGQTIRQNPFTFGAKSLKRLKVAANAVRYYDSVGRSISAANMHYSNVLKTFELEHNSLVKRKKEDEPEVPKITRKTSVPEWSKSFDDFLHRIIGVRDAPLAYLVREDADPGQAPTLAPGKPYSTIHGSMEQELIARLTHNSPVYRDDDSKLYHYLEKATRGTIYSASLAPYARSKNGREAYMALMSQHAGKDKWEKEIKDQNDFLTTRVWKGNTNFTLESFIKQHRVAYITTQQCCQHVSYQLPNERTRGSYLLDAIQCNDAVVQATLAGVRKDDPGMCDNFESAASYLLPSCPVARKKKSDKRPYEATISSTAGTGKKSTPKTSLKPGVGKTGVALRFHKISEYKKLNEEQKAELAEWRKNRKNKPDNAKPTAVTTSNKKLKTMVSEMLATELSKIEDTRAQEEAERQLIHQNLVSFAESHKPSTSKPAQISFSTVPSPAVQQAISGIQGILRRIKKSS